MKNLFYFQILKIINSTHLPNIGGIFRTLIFVIIILYHIPLKAQGNDKSLIGKIDSLAGELITSGKAAGLSLTVTKDANTIISKGYGSADLMNKTPVTTNTIFRIASITKQFTAVSILQLIEKGKLNLNDPITKFIPDYPTQGSKVTIKHLLNHTSGIKNITALGNKYWSQIDSEITPSGLISMFKNEPFDFKPGENYSYSNSGYIILGYIIEKITGLSYGDYITKNIIEPLGLKNTYYNPDSTKLTNLAKSYSNNSGKIITAPPVNLSQGYSEGGICSTPEDLTEFINSLNSGKLINKVLYKKMITPLHLKNGEVLNYGFGIGVGELQGHPLLFHAGGIFGADAQAIYFPKDKLSIVILSNTDNSGVMTLENQISKIILHVKEPVIKKLSPNQILKYLGKYKRGSFEVEVLLDNGEPALKGMWNENPVPLYYLGKDTFAGKGELESIKFKIKNGKAEKLILTHYGAKIVELNK